MVKWPAVNHLIEGDDWLPTHVSSVRPSIACTEHPTPNMVYFMVIIIGSYILFKQVTTIAVNNPVTCLDIFVSNKNYGLIVFYSILLSLETARSSKNDFKMKQLISPLITFT